MTDFTDRGAPAPYPSHQPDTAPSTPSGRPSRPRWPWIVGGVLAVAVVVVAIAISGSDDGDGPRTDRPESTVTPPGADAETAEGVELGQAASGVPDPAVAYFEAFASEDLSRMGAMLDNSLEGSPAALYATHQIANVRALGSAPLPASVEVTEDNIVLRSTTYDLKGDEVEEATNYSHFEVDGDRLTAFTVDDIPLADRIRAGDPIGTSGDGVTVRVVTAYLTARGDLWLNLDITNARGDVVEVADYEWSLVTPDGRQLAPSENLCCPTAPSVEPSATAGHIAMFEQVRLGGTLRFVAFADDFVTEIRFDIPVPS